VTPDPQDTRYHVYVLREGELIALSSTSKDGLGTALVQHFEDGEFGHDASIGILDRLEGGKGRWIANPWAGGSGRLTGATKEPTKEERP
jgi:hypothetical protein